MEKVYCNGLLYVPVHDDFKVARTLIFCPFLAKFSCLLVPLQRKVRLPACVSEGLCPVLDCVEQLSMHLQNKTSLRVKQQTFMKKG